MIRYSTLSLMGEVNRVIDTRINCLKWTHISFSLSSEISVALDISLSDPSAGGGSAETRFEAIGFISRNFLEYHRKLTGCDLFTRHPWCGNALAVTQKVHESRTCLDHMMRDYGHVIYASET